MATGALLDGGILAASTGFGGGWDAARDPIDIAEDPIVASASPLGGTLTNTQPITEIEAELDGAVLPGFAADYYERIHYSFRSFNFGSAAIGQQQILQIWNAFFVDKTITAATPSGSGGIAATGPGALPYDVSPLAEIEYTFEIEATAPPVLAVTYSFTIGGVTVPIEFAGLLVTPWFVRPSGGVLERLDWLTDVLPSFNGEEQRRALRLAPRRAFEFDVVMTAAERRAYENALQDWQGRMWALPVWMDAQPLPADLAPGATVIAIDTTTRDFVVGGTVGIALDSRTYEVIQLEAKTDSSLTLKAPGVSGAWPAGRTVVFPIRAARMPESVALRRFTGAASYARMRFEVAEACDWPAAVESTYRSLPVLATPPNWVEDVDQEFLRMLARLDGGTGQVFVDDEAGGPHILQSHQWLLDGRAQIDAFRRWLYARRGRLTAFWLPTFAEDFIVVASIGSAALTIDVEHCGYTLAIAQDIARRDIRIELASGTVFYRRITGCTEVSSTVERLSIDSALGVIVAPADIRAVSYLAPVRLEADGVEIAWERHDLAESRLMTRASRNDL